NCLAIQQGNEPAHWTYKAFVGLAPVHILRPINRRKLFRETFRQNLGRSTTLFCDFRRNTIAFGSGNHLKLGDVYSGFLGETVGCRSRLAVLVSNVYRGTRYLFDNIRLSSRYSLRHHGQAPRRFERSDISAAKPLTGQYARNPLAQFLRRGVNHPRGNFFAPYL